MIVPIVMDWEDDEFYKQLKGKIAIRNPEVL